MARIFPGFAFIYSGGQTNTSPSLSIGGQASFAAERYLSSQTYTQLAQPGVQIVHAARNAAGTGTLSYIAATKTFTWLSPDGYSSEATATESGFYTVGSTLSGFLRLSVTYSSLPSSDFTASIPIAEAQGSLFGSPSATELTNGVTEYRCVYLINESVSNASGITVSFTDNAPQSTVLIGSLFDPVSRYGTPSSKMNSLSLLSPLTGTPFLTPCTDPMAAREQLIVKQRDAGPFFMYYPTDVVQSSNGIDEYVAPQLADRYDSTNLLAQVSWGTSLSWPYINPGKMVSFYVKRTFPPNPVVPTYEYVDFDMSVTVS